MAWKVTSRNTTPAIKRGLTYYQSVSTQQHLTARLKLLEETRFEKLPVTVYPDQHEASKRISRRIADLIVRKQMNGWKAVLGLAAGVTPIEVYEELVRLHREERLSFQNVVTFNLNEYFPMKPYSAQSYVAFTKENLNTAGMSEISAPRRPLPSG